MLVSEYHKPIAIPLKKISDTPIMETGDKDVVILDSPVFSSIIITKGASPVKMYKLSAPANIFVINFNYLQKLYRTKALKVNCEYRVPFYKVVLGSNLSKNASICWLQQEQQGWIMLLGPELDEGLKRAITSAIECRDV